MAAEPAMLQQEPAARPPAIQISGVGVRFLLPRRRIASFKEYLIHRLKQRVEHEELWALRGVDLEIRPGEVFGVVGRNGAGKSTLLRVLSRVLRPTLGRVIVRGRVAPLLGLGAGMHPDLSGRENVFLYGSVLGHSRRRLERHFDEVLEFSELQEFIDVPTRNYSSGMVARLGYAVATLFRPDVLLLDEVLAVGDIGFQQKCLERLASFRAQGTTTVLVSHSLETVVRYCNRVAWIERGEIRRLGPAEEAVAAYQEFVASASSG